MKIEITLNKKLLNNRDCDFFHYECGYELAKCEYGRFMIWSRGELKCSYYNEDGQEETDINYIIRDIVKNNKHLTELINNGYEDKLPKIIQDMNNWFEIEMLDNDGNYINNITEECYGSISECLKEFEELIKDEDYIEELKDCFKEHYIEKLNYMEDKIEVCAYGKEELQEIEELKYQIGRLGE